MIEGIIYYINELNQEIYKQRHQYYIWKNSQNKWKYCFDNINLKKEIYFKIN